MILHEETVKQLKEMIKYFEHLETVTTDKDRRRKYLKMKSNVIDICNLFAVKID